MNQRRPKLICLLFFASALLLVTGGHAFAADGIRTESLTFERGRVLYKGVRYQLEGPHHGQPVLLVHGFSCTTFAFESMGKLLASRGYDVYIVNLPSHGNGAQKSRILGDDRFKQHRFTAYIEHVRNMVEHIAEATGNKVLYGGHSMGAMLGKLVAAGARVTDDGRVVQDPKLEERMQELLLGSFLDGLAVGFNKFPFFMRKGAGPFSKAFEKLVVSGPWADTAFPTGVDPDPRSLIGRARARLVGWFVDVFPAYRNLDSATREELKEFFLKGMSNPPLALILDFMHFMAYGYPHSQVRAHGQPTVVFIGQNDMLANPSEVVRDYHEWKKSNSNVVLVKLQNTGHLKVVVGRATAEAAAVFFDLLRLSESDPDRYREAIARFPSRELTVDPKRGMITFDGVNQPKLSLEAFRKEYMADLPIEPIASPAVEHATLRDPALRREMERLSFDLHLLPDCRALFR